MLILFDHGTPKGLIQALAGHDIVTAQSRGWSSTTGRCSTPQKNSELSFCSQPTEEFAISKILPNENSPLLF